jgi:uncharacterized membrane protein YpjA
VTTSADPREPHSGVQPTPDPHRTRRPGGWGAWGRLARWAIDTRWVVWTLAIANLSQCIAGYIYWYGTDILSSPVYLWPFVPDSPLSGTLVAVALLAFHYGRRWEYLGLLAATGAIKYGLWTDWIWFTNALSGGATTLEAVVLSGQHFAMALEGLLLLPLLRPRLRHAAFVTAWYLFNDLTDYGFGEHPRIPNPEDLSVITWFAVGSTVLLCGLWFIWASRRRAAPART